MQHNPNCLLTEQELANFLKIAPGTLRHSRSSGKDYIPYVRVGGSIRYRVEDVNEYLAKQVVGNAG